jgi:hypothetical protein
MRTIRGPHHTALHRLPHGWHTSKGGSAAITRGTSRDQGRSRAAPHRTHVENDVLNDRAHEAVVEIMVAGVAGIAKLYLDGNTHVLFYAGIILLLVLVLMVRSNFIVLLRIGNHYMLRLPYLTKLDQEEIAQK